MKILVDEMPNSPAKCLFHGSEIRTRWDKTAYECRLSEMLHDYECCINVKECPYLTEKEKNYEDM